MVVFLSSHLEDPPADALEKLSNQEDRQGRRYTDISTFLAKKLC